MRYLERMLMDAPGITTSSCLTTVWTACISVVFPLLRYPQNSRVDGLVSKTAPRREQVDGGSLNKANLP
jgi:hypothetical protein